MVLEKNGCGGWIRTTVTWSRARRPAAERPRSALTGIYYSKQAAICQGIKRGVAKDQTYPPPHFPTSEGGVRNLSSLRGEVGRGVCKRFLQRFWLSIPGWQRIFTHPQESSVVFGKSEHNHSRPAGSLAHQRRMRVASTVSLRACPQGRRSNPLRVVVKRRGLLRRCAPRNDTEGVEGDCFVASLLAMRQGHRVIASLPLRQAKQSPSCCREAQEIGSSLRCSP